MTRFLAAAALIIAVAPASALAQSITLRGPCDGLTVTPADYTVCACAGNAAKARTAGKTSGVDPDYSDWWTGFSVGGVVTVRPVKPAGFSPNARANDGCFDLPDILVGDYSVRNALTSELVLIAKEAAAQGGYAFAVSTRDDDLDTLAKQDTATSLITFGAETTVDSPIAANPGIIIAPLDPFTAELLDEEGPLGTVHTNGRSVEGAYLQDMDGDQFLDVVMFLEDGGNFILTGPLHPGASFDLPMQ